MDNNYEAETVSAAYGAAKEAQRTINDALTHALVRLTVKCTDPVLHSDIGQGWRIRHPVWFAEGAVHIPLDNEALARWRIGSEDVDQYAGRCIVAAEKIRNVHTAIGELNHKLKALVDFDVIVHTSFDDKTSQVRLSVLKRFPNPPNEDHEKAMRETMLETIQDMRAKQHKDLPLAERAFEDRFGEPWREEIAASDNLDSQPNYNDLGPTKYAVPRL